MGLHWFLPVDSITHAILQHCAYNANLPATICENNSLFDLITFQWPKLLFLILEVFKEWLLHVDNQVNLKKKKIGHLHKEILPWGTSLVVQWLRIHFPMQGTHVRSLVRELRFYMSQGSKACELQRLSPHTSSWEPTCHKLDYRPNY